MKAKILAAVAFIGVLLAAIFRGSAAKEKAKAAGQRADIAEATADVNASINTGLSDLEKTHSKEEGQDNEAIARGDRSGLDNHW